MHVAKHCQRANGNVYVAVDLACAQADAGYDVTFVSGGGHFVELLEQHGIRHVMMPQELSRPLDLVRGAFRLVGLARSVRPDILHAHMIAAAGLGFIASRLTGIKLVNTMHNSFDPQSIVMRLGDKVVAVSNAERDTLLARGYKPEYTTAVVNAAVNSPREPFMKNQREFPLEHPCIGIICALHRRKGVFDVINAFKTLTNDFPEWRLYIAGEGPDRPMLEKQAVSLGLSDRIVFLEFVTDPKPIFAQLDIFILASYADPGSLSIGEARANGCAIIATSVGGTTEMLDNGKAGRLIQPGNAEQMAAELRGLMQDPEARAALRAAARDGSERFDVATLVPRYEAVYRELLTI